MQFWGDNWASLGNWFVHSVSYKILYANPLSWMGLFQKFSTILSVTLRFSDRGLSRKYGSDFIPLIVVIASLCVMAPSFHCVLSSNAAFIDFLRLSYEVCFIFFLTSWQTNRLLKIEFFGFWQISYIFFSFSFLNLILSAKRIFDFNDQFSQYLDTWTELPNLSSNAVLSLSLQVWLSSSVV